MIKWLAKQLKPVVKEVIEELKPIIKEVAVEAAKTYVKGELEKSQQK